MTMPDSLALKWSAFSPLRPWGLWATEGGVFKRFDTAEKAISWLRANGYADPEFEHRDSATAVLP